jgi:RND family efflux transporter MFP subunit
LQTAQGSLQTAQDGLRTAQTVYQNSLTMVAKAKQDLQRFENLMKENATTDMQVQNAKLGVTQAENGANQAQGGINQAQGGVNQAEMAIKQAQMSINQAQFGIKTAETQVATTRKMIEQCQVKAPISGVITAKMFDLGSMVGPGAPLGMVTDISTLKLAVMIPESEVMKFSVGQRTTLMTDIYDGVKFGGSISLIAAKSDNAHSYKVEISVENSAGNPIKAGMYGRLISGAQAAAGVEGIFIPRGVLVGSIKEPRVYVVEAGKAVLRELTLGASSGDWISVQSGLNEGEQLITTGQINLENGTPVSIVSK